jgi:isoamylase/glycogen operon protein
MPDLVIKPGIVFPFGVFQTLEGINFAVFSKHAASATLCIYDLEQRPVSEIPLEPKTYKFGFVWHACIEGLQPPFFYAYRFDGVNIENGNLFNPENLLLDPYSREVSSVGGWRNHEVYQPLGVYSAMPFDWEGTAFPNIPWQDLIIYEMHARGFTVHPSSKAAHPGTFLGVIEKIPYLLELGITAVEFLPLQEFNENETRLVNPETGEKLCNYWGYSTVNFFSPMKRYTYQDGPGMAMQEFKTMVRELHRNGIEVILDIVFNHTAEGNEKGPILSFKGIDNSIYYILEKQNGYMNLTGCGNTVNCNHPVVSQWILDCLRYWVLEMHVDGFRFDLASIFFRGEDGQALNSSPLVAALSEDPILAQTKLIAEPWDAAGLYQVGNFYRQSARWSEWNGRYRDNVRRFIRGVTDAKGEFATRLCGSQDLYHGLSPLCSLNYVTAHDGFSLRDLVSYNEKHNFANGEDNQDGFDDNESWNCGIEGPASDPAILALRERQMRNFHLTLMVSSGVPMLVMGDEYGHTRKGNNNPWCQDNDLNWMLWDQLERNAGFARYYRVLVQFRKNNPLLKRTAFISPQDIQWHGAEPSSPNWAHGNGLIAYSLIDHEKHEDIYIAFNAQNQNAFIEFPAPHQNMAWHWIANSSNAVPEDCYEEAKAPEVSHPIFKMLPFSSLLLKSLSQ